MLSLRREIPSGRENKMVNETIRTMLERRSIRKYTEEQIRDEELALLLECALYAPTSSNTQCSRFLVMQDPALLAELNAAMCRELAGRELQDGQVMNVGIRAARQEGMNFMYHAPTYITAVAPRSYANSMASCVTGLENIQLAAWSLGLGTCWGNQPHWLTDVPEIREIFARVGLQEEEDIFGSLAVGYPAYVSTKDRPRKEGRIVLDRPRNLK